jgi:MFS family permease
MAGMALILVLALAILFMPPNTLPHYLIGFLFGVASGAAMIPYTIIKEVNPDEVKGSATGAINFLVFVMSAFAAPACGWLLQQLSGGHALTLDVFREGGMAGIAAVVIAIVLGFFIRETGAAAHNDR